jgi:hypothetical protein
VVADLATVQNYVDRARVLLQDQGTTERYPDADIVDALNSGISEAARVRPDLFLTYLRTRTIPSYSVGSLATAVDIDPIWRSTFLNYIVGYIQIRDDEDTQDARAAAFLNTFVAQLTMMRSTPA